MSVFGFDNNSPNWSITVTFSDGKLGTDEDTKWTIDWTCCLPKERPCDNLTKTEAEGSAVSRAKTVFSGIARWTLADEIPEIKFSDFDNSVSRVCLIFTASTIRRVKILYFPGKRWKRYDNSLKDLWIWKL